MLLSDLARRLARQFTFIVLLLLLAVGGIYLSLSNYTLRRESDQRLTQQVDTLESQISLPISTPTNLLLTQRQRLLIRIADGTGNPVLTGSLFSEIDVPLEPNRADTFYAVGGPTSTTYRVLSRTLYGPTGIRGYIQVAEPEDFGGLALVKESALYLLVCVLISAVTYLLGLRFSRQTLKPAQESIERLEQFTQDASHELRTPLAVMNSTLDLALKSHAYKQGILSAKEDIANASLLVERLLELARLDSLTLRKEDLDLSTLVQDLASKYSLLAEQAGLTLGAAIEPNIEAKGDGSLIRQLISNVIDNAIKFTPAGGTVTINLIPGSLEIIDTGEGIPSTKLASIFERFYQADSSRSKDGFGLGLAIVKRIADLHGWEVRVESHTKKGSRFNIGFPTYS